MYDVFIHVRIGTKFSSVCKELYFDKVGGSHFIFCLGNRNLYGGSDSEE